MTALFVLPRLDMEHARATCSGDPDREIRLNATWVSRGVARQTGRHNTCQANCRNNIDATPRGGEHGDQGEWNGDHR